MSFSNLIQTLNCEVIINLEKCNGHLTFSAFDHILRENLMLLVLSVLWLHTRF